MIVMPVLLVFSVCNPMGLYMCSRMCTSGRASTMWRRQWRAVLPSGTPLCSRPPGAVEARASAKCVSVPSKFVAVVSAVVSLPSFFPTCASQSPGSCLPTQHTQALSESGIWGLIPELGCAHDMYMSSLPGMHAMLGSFLHTKGRCL